MNVQELTASQSVTRKSLPLQRPEKGLPHRISARDSSGRRLSLWRRSRFGPTGLSSSYGGRTALTADVCLSLGDWLIYSLPAMPECGNRSSPQPRQSSKIGQPSTRPDPGPGQSITAWRCSAEPAATESAAGLHEWHHESRVTSL